MPKIVTEGTKRYLKVEIPKFPKIKLPRLSTLNLTALRLPGIQLVVAALALIGLLAFAYIALRVFMNVTVEERPPEPSAEPRGTMDPDPSQKSQPIPFPKETTTAQPQEAIKQKELQKTAELKVKAGIFVAELKAGMTTKDYSVTPIASNELVQGKKGKYFIVNLLDAETTQPIYFPNGKYVLNELESRFAYSLNKFNAAVLKKVEILGARVFVQGKADSLAAQFKSSFTDFECNGESSNMISFHPSVGGSKYKFSERFRSRNVGPMFGNDDLPFLRARFLQCRLQTIYQASSIEVIEGEVDPLENKQSRSGTFILYVPQSQLP